MLAATCDDYPPGTRLWAKLRGARGHLHMSCGYTMNQMKLFDLIRRHTHLGVDGDLCYRAGSCAWPAVMWSVSLCRRLDVADLASEFRTGASTTDRVAFTDSDVCCLFSADMC